MNETGGTVVRRCVCVVGGGDGEYTQEPLAPKMDDGWDGWTVDDDWCIEGG